MIWFTMLYKVVPTFQSVDKVHVMVQYLTKWFQLFSLWMKSKSAEQYFPVGTFILMSVLGGLASGSADEILG